MGAASSIKSCKLEFKAPLRVLNGTEFTTQSGLYMQIEWLSPMTILSVNFGYLINSAVSCIFLRLSKSTSCHAFSIAPPVCFALSRRSFIIS